MLMRHKKAMGGKSELSCLALANQAECRQLRVADVQLRGITLGMGRGIKHIYPDFSRDFDAVPLFTLLSRLRENLICRMLMKDRCPTGRQTVA